MKRILLSAVAIISLSACSLTPEYSRPTLDQPTIWEGETSDKSEVIPYAWWKSFEDETLNSLMAAALEKNTNITAGIQVVEQSRAALKISGADLWPSLKLDNGISTSNTNPNTGASYETNRYSAGLSASYELDLFGGNRADKDAARANLLSSIYTQEALELVVMADVAQNYFTLLNLYERLNIADKNLSSRREVLRIIQVRVNEGADSDLELAQQRNLVASAEASRAQIIELITNAKNALAVLLGRAPQGFSVAEKRLDGIQIPEVATGQPSELLERRPDIKAIEADLVAANANIGAARAAFYPSISLGIDDTFSIAGFGDPSTSALTLAAAITTPIFQGGALQGSLDSTTARELELVEMYRGAVYESFKDVEDALAAVKAAKARKGFLETAMLQSRRAYSLSKERYDAGAIDFQTLLDTQISLLSAEDTYAQSRLSELTASVLLYKAMGGGWSH